MKITSQYIPPPPPTSATLRQKLICPSTLPVLGCASRGCLFHTGFLVEKQSFRANGTSCSATRHLLPSPTPPPPNHQLLARKHGSTNLLKRLILSGEEKNSRQGAIGFGSKGYGALYGQSLQQSEGKTTLDS